MYRYWNDGTSLYHHGIPGMKWGVRNGPPYPLGTEQKTNRKKKKDYQDAYYEKNVKSSSKHGRTLKDVVTSKEFKRAVIIGASAIAVGLAAYGTYKLVTNNSVRYGPLTYPLNEPLIDNLENYSDIPITLPEGTKIQRISKVSFDDMVSRGQTYVSYLKRDNSIYKYRFTNEIYYDFGERPAFVQSLIANQEIKAPSSRELAKIYLEDVASKNTNDNTFRLVLSRGFLDKKASNDDPITQRLLAQADKLRDALIKRGYNAIIDPVDSLDYATAPLIVLNPEDSLKNIGSHKLGKIEKIIAKFTS